MLHRIYEATFDLIGVPGFESYFSELQRRRPGIAPSFDEARKDFTALTPGGAEVWTAYL